MRSRALLCLLAAPLLAWAEPPANAPWLPELVAENCPRINGSTSMQPVSDLLAAKLLGLPGRLARPGVAWPEFMLGANGSPDAPMVVFPMDVAPKALQEYRRLWSRMRHQGTDKAYLAVIEGSADLALIARQPSQDEMKAARVANVELVTRPVALDAFVFLVNARNPVQSLAPPQLRAIYSGMMTNWQAVGGPDRPIIAYTRQRNSGSEELMRTLVMEGQNTFEGAGERMLMGMMGPIDAVSAREDAIAYSVFYYEHVMAPREQNRLLAVEGVAPTSQTIAQRRYPLVADVYLVTRKDLPAASLAAKLAEKLLGVEGQELMAEAGYVPARALP